MAVGNVMNGLKRKMEQLLYGEEEVQQPMQPQAQGYAPAPDAAFAQPQVPQYAPVQANFYQPQAPAAPQQPSFQPQMQQAPAAPQQPVYQAQPQQPAPNAWNSRFAPKQEKVVNIRDYQQPAPEMPPVEENRLPQQATTRVVCARGMMDCRLAITLLRAGDAVLVTMENVKDPAEMRRLVDTLSGACYSLSASITKVSRYGVYLLAPQTMVVYADQMINQMNSTAAPKPQQRPAYQPGQRPAYQQAQQPYQQPMQQPAQQTAYQPMQQAAYQQPAPQQPVYQQPAPQQPAFTQRTAAPQENSAAFYARPQQQAAPQMPAFSSQMANTGYVPDDMEVAE